VTPSGAEAKYLSGCPRRTTHDLKLNQCIWERIIWNYILKSWKSLGAYQSKQKNSCAGEKQEDFSKQTLDASKPNLYDVICNDDVREVVALLITKNQCFFKHGKKGIARIDVSDLYTNGTLDLGNFFHKLKKRPVYTGKANSNWHRAKRHLQ